jgi:hypothetical protein
MLNQLLIGSHSGSLSSRAAVEQHYSTMANHERLPAQRELRSALGSSQKNAIV